mmetsp:Transcript_53558/g.85593  ORF Transcript_53558/g.85593 Transcript_53558/m.85593 type:complete len:81 (-) Transcript_53558:263-505(-)
MQTMKEQWSAAWFVMVQTWVLVQVTPAKMMAILSDLDSVTRSGLEQTVSVLEERLLANWLEMLWDPLLVAMCHRGWLVSV